MSMLINWGKLPPTTGAHVMTQLGLGQITAIEGQLAEIKLENGKLVKQFTGGDGFWVLPKLSVGDTVHHEDLGRGRVTKVISPMMMQVQFEKGFGRGGNTHESLMDIRRLRLYCKAEAPPPKVSETKRGKRSKAERQALAAEHPFRPSDRVQRR